MTDLQVDSRISIPQDEFEFRFDRSSGPGGQNVNKVNTKATLHWSVGETPSLPEGVRRRFVARFANRINRDGQLVLASQRHREQSRNAEDCLQRVRQMVLQVIEPPKARKRRRVSQAAKRRRVEQKRRRSQVKQLRKPPSL
jgi:ribosome-associated protein